MRADAARADRMQSVREAAAGWLRLGWIDNATGQAIADAYPDDRVRVGVTFRILFFILTMCALMGALAISFLLLRHTLGESGLALIAGLGCVCLMEYLVGPLKRRQGGIEAAVSVFAVGLVIFAVAALDQYSWGVSSRYKLAFELLWAALLCLAASWRWGYWPYSAAAGFLFFMGTGELPFARLYWILVPTLLFGWLSVGCDSPRLPPALRKSSTALLTACILAFYAAINIFSLDNHLIGFYGFSTPAPGLVARLASITMSAAVPVVVLLLGIRTRRRLFLDLGFLLGIASLITLRQYVHLAPLWSVMVTGGFALLALGVILNRILGGGNGKQRHGFTAGQLLENPKQLRAIELLASMTTLTPGAKAPPEKPGFQGEGGKFGGGGASGEF